MKLNDKETAFGELAALIGGAAAGFVWYCEKLQFLPTHSKTFLASLLAVFFGGGLLLFLFFCLIRKGIAKVRPGRWLPIILISLVLSVLLTVWFPVPDTGLYPKHTLEIRALPDETGQVLPVTLSWLHRTGGDIPLEEVRCEGSCETIREYGPTLSNEADVLRWQGKTGDLITIEFVSGTGQGTAEIRWDNSVMTIGLSNESLERLSINHAFPTANGLPEFIAVWILFLLLSFGAVIMAVELFPAWSVRRFWWGAFLCFAVFRVLQFTTVQEPLTFIDSESYLGMSRMPVTDILTGTPYCHDQYWYCIARPAFIPLVYKLCGQNLQMITLVQLIVSVLSWGIFARLAAEPCRTPLSKKAAILLILGLGCVPNVTRWDQIIMSESLSISAAALMMGCCFRLLKPNREKRWKVLPAIGLGLSALLYAQSRDSAVWSVILIIVLLLCLMWIRSNRKVILLLVLALAGVCWSVMSSSGGRWQYPFENVLFNRILRDPQGESFFISAGMPTPLRIKELYGVEHMMGSELFNSDEMAPLREWIASDGLKAYLLWLLRDPAETLKLAFENGFEIEAYEQIGYTFTPSGFKALLPEPLIKFFACSLPAVFILGAGLWGLWKAFRSRDGERFAFPVLFVLSAYILCTGVLLADEYEFARHSMVILIMMKASVWTLLSMLFEKN